MKISKERQLFDNRALVALIIPLIIEQFLAVLVGSVSWKEEGGRSL